MCKRPLPFRVKHSIKEWRVEGDMLSPLPPYRGDRAKTHS